MGRKKLVGSAAVLLGLLSVLLPTVRADEDPNKSPAICVPEIDDQAEPGMQGEVPAGQDPHWKCGVRIIGSVEEANGEMAVAGHCAYTGGGADETDEVDEVHAGVRVIDVSDPTAPWVVRVLDTGSRELLAAKVSEEDPNRAILVTRHRDDVNPNPEEGRVLGQDMLVDVWDIAGDCTDPQYIRTLRFPTASKLYGDPPGETGGPVHNLTLNRTATKVYGTIPLQEADISDPNPDHWTVRDLHCAVSNQHYEVYKQAAGVPVCETLQGEVWTMPSNSHEASFNPDNSRLYIGSQIPGPNNNAMYILDMTTGDPRVVSVTEQSPGHSIDFFTVDGNQYLLHSNELVGTACIPEAQRPKYVGMGDRVYILDIENETKPTPKSEFLMAVSKFDNCGPNNTGGPSTAYHHVNDPKHSRWAIIGFGSAGFRIVDIQDPGNPIEVAYFNYGASEHTKPYIIPGTNQMWVSGAGRFWVLELAPEVVAALDRHRKDLRKS
jgi:hypothetical protein